MCKVNVTELRSNFAYYLDLSSKENVFVTKNNKVIAVISSPEEISYNDFLKLGGCLETCKVDTNKDDIILEEILKR